MSKYLIWHCWASESIARWLAPSIRPHSLQVPPDMEPSAEERSSTMSLSSGEHISDGEESIRSESQMVKDLQKQAERWADCTAEWRDRWGKIKDERDFALKKARGYKKRLEETTSRLQQLEADNRALREELKRPLSSPQQQQQVSTDEGIEADESADVVPTVHFRRRSEPVRPHSFSFPSSSKDDGLGSSAESSSPPISSAAALDLSAFSLETELKLIQDLVKSHEREESTSDVQGSPRPRMVSFKVFGPMEGDREDFSFWQHKKRALSKSVSADTLHSDSNPAAAAGERATGVPSKFPPASPEWRLKVPLMGTGTGPSEDLSVLLSGNRVKETMSEKARSRLSLGRKVELPSDKLPPSEGEKAMKSERDRLLHSCNEEGTQCGGDAVTQSREDKATQSGEKKTASLSGRSERPPETLSWNEMTAQNGAEKVKSPLGEKSLASSTGKMMPGGSGGEMVRKGGVLAKGNRPYVDLATRWEGRRVKEGRADFITHSITSPTCVSHSVRLTDMIPKTLMLNSKFVRTG